MASCKARVIIELILQFRGPTTFQIPGSQREELHIPADFTFGEEDKPWEEDNSVTVLGGECGQNEMTLPSRSAINKKKHSWYICDLLLSTTKYLCSIKVCC